MSSPASKSHPELSDVGHLDEPQPPVRRRRWKRWVLTVVVLLGVFVTLAAIKGVQIKMMIDAQTQAHDHPPPVTVSAAPVQQIDVQPTLTAVGSLVAARDIVVGSELPGTVREIDFKNGSRVSKGSVLVKLDTSTEEAELIRAQAQAVLAKQTLDRATQLRASGANTPADLDAAKAQDAQARAGVAELESVIAKKTIRAPFDGRVGIRSVDLGQVVAPGAPIVTLQSDNPIEAQFELPQEALAQLSVGQKVAVQVDVFPNQTWEGIVTTIDPRVDPTTRNVRFRAAVPNADGKLLPGMFASVIIDAGAQQKELAVPATSIIYATYGDSVFVVEKDTGEKGASGLVAKQRFIRVGETKGDFVVVSDGLKLGESVVSTGGFKLRSGQQVFLSTAGVPDFSLHPKTPVDL